MKPGSAEVFLDAAGLLALFNARDALHRAAAEVLTEMQRGSTPAVTSVWVLTEFLAGVSRPGARGSASGFVKTLLRQPRVTVIEASHEGWQGAFALYSRRADKERSLVDCASMLTCKDRDIRRVFTHDHHFTQAGFEILL